MKVHIPSPIVSNRPINELRPIAHNGGRTMAIWAQSRHSVVIKGKMHMSDNLYKAALVVAVAIVLAAIIETLPYWHCASENSSQYCVG